jgi:hypothetical protein|tara:strand:- start:6632 stop:7003 length:372 start_codon:yes stop_codon:yes gene_type:complete
LKLNNLNYKKLTDIDIKISVLGSELTYLNGNTNSEVNNLINDRKIQEGVDTRSYKVSFDKITRILSNFQCKWIVEKDIKNLLDELKQESLNGDIFNQREFYRLQQIEFLHQTQQINNDLFWIK